MRLFLSIPLMMVLAQGILCAEDHVTVRVYSESEIEVGLREIVVRMNPVPLGSVDAFVQNTKRNQRAFLGRFVLMDDGNGQQISVMKRHIELVVNACRSVDVPVPALLLAYMEGQQWLGIPSVVFAHRVAVEYEAELVDALERKVSDLGPVREAGGKPILDTGRTYKIRIKSGIEQLPPRPSK